jgi:hypothetical protein
MTPLRLALICAFGILLVTPQAAAGGGWWSSISVDRSTVAAGQRVEVKASVYFSSVAAAKEAGESGRFYVHVLRGFDYAVLEAAMREAEPRDWWTLGGAETIRVAPVTVTVQEHGMGRARAAFTLPELPPATYHVMICDATCSEPFAEVVPTPDFTVVADPATAELTQRADRLNRRLRQQATQLAEARADAYRARGTAEDTQSEIDQLQLRFASLAAEARRPEPATPGAYVGWLVTATLAGALVLLILRRRRSDRAASWHPSDDELRELLASEPEGQEPLRSRRA